MKILLQSNQMYVQSPIQLSHSVVTQFKSEEWPSDEVLITKLHLMTTRENLKFECPTLMRNLSLILLLHLTVSRKYPCLEKTS